jgi:carbonic anhydrase/acetyltransferase-like protein (isoleucine patch superfamily)
VKYRDWTPNLGAGVFVADTARVIGNVEVGARASIWFGVVVRGDVHEIRIGAETNIQDGAIVHCTRKRFGTYIGAGVTVGHAAVLHGCTIEDGAFIGMKACVMDGAVVESGAMVAAGALVTPGKRVKAGEVWAGSPAKLLRAVSIEEAADIPASAQRYADLAAEYLAAQ